MWYFAVARISSYSEKLSLKCIWKELNSLSSTLKLQLFNEKALCCLKIKPKYVNLIKKEKFFSDSSLHYTGMWSLFHVHK